ncbi:uncharacterized protein SCHCODRAFT_02602935 [Schizophyllum commune H4-8]|uniref:Uncharacterized protein n=1 Tax=Schizophyllum commune (strain H4-8 / FGSC 9210) TaxID=578458 RepID=D8QJI4_SCHCM|nr:uncharacterized protein SCHCODRAFT_02602935 [Schizophyllum commune H4-8]KAI5886313.1 hypothetical protein SCHCODRAFT_02602935 [Schizophyllum commune H4-8]
MLGLFLALVFAVIHYTRREHPRSSGASPTPRNEWTREDRLLFVGSMVLTVTTSANWICSCLRLLKAYHASSGSAPSHIEMDSTVSAAQVVLRVLTWCVADMVVISRVYVVWSGKLAVIILPAISLAVLLASGMAIAYDTAVLDADSPDTTFANWKLVNSWSTIFTNVYCTGMITWRILRVSRAHAQTGKSPLSAALAALVESAMFYTTIAILTYATAEAEHVSNAFFIEISAPSAALASVVIHVRAIWRRERWGGETERWRGDRAGPGGMRGPSMLASASPKPGVGASPMLGLGASPMLGLRASSMLGLRASPAPKLRVSSICPPVSRRPEDHARGSWDVEAQRRGDKASGETRESEKEWGTRSRSDGNSSSTSTLRPMSSAVVR